MKRIVIIAIATIAIVAIALGRELLQTFNHPDTYHTTANIDFVKICPKIDTNANVVVDPTGSLTKVMQRLGELKSSQEGIVSILHLGDSHIQGNYLTSTMRKAFQSDFGNAGRGLILPTKLIGTNGASDYKISSPNHWDPLKCTVSDDCNMIGASGLGISCKDRDVEIDINSEEKFNSIRVLHHENAPRLLEPTELEVGFCCTTEDTPQSTRVVLNQDMNNVTLRARSDGNYSTQIFYGFILENGHSGVLYNSAGVNGAGFSHFDNNRITSGIADIGSDLIIISLGTNDSFGDSSNPESVHTQIDGVVSKIRKANPDVPIILTTPMETCRSIRRRGRRTVVTNSSVKVVSGIIVDYATKNGLAYWDFYTIAGGAGANSAWRKRDLVRSDMVHMSIKGYDLQGQLFYNALIRGTLNN